MIQGITNVTYDLNYDLNTMVMTQTIAESMEGIYVNNITDFMVSGLTFTNSNGTGSGPTSSMSAAAAQGFQIHHRVLQSTADMMIIQYVVVDNRTDANYTVLSSQLTSSVYSGDWDKRLHAHALAAGATSLTNVSCIYIITQSVDEWTDEPTMAPTLMPTLESSPISEQPTLHQPTMYPTYWYPFDSSIRVIFGAAQV